MGPRWCRPRAGSPSPSSPHCANGPARNGSALFSSTGPLRSYDGGLVALTSGRAKSVAVDAVGSTGRAGSLLRLVKVSQIRGCLVLLGRHQVAVVAQEVGLRADRHMVVPDRADVLH